LQLSRLQPCPVLNHLTLRMYDDVDETILKNYFDKLFWKY